MSFNRNGPFSNQYFSTTNLLPSSGRPGPSKSTWPTSLGASSISQKPTSVASSIRVEAGGRSSTGHPSSLSDKYSLSPSPATWGMPLLMNYPEADDVLHNPDPRRDRKDDSGGTVFTIRGIGNLGCLSILAFAFLGLFTGYPIVSHFTSTRLSNQGGFNLGGINATGQVPDLPGNYLMIDKHTPQDALTYPSYMDQEEMVLVFSDEFQQDGRTFYPGDDPFWEAVDLHYWGTNDLEWYDPEQVTTKNGSLQLRIDLVTDTENNHNMMYRSGMVQSWNKFCFTGGLIVASVMLPGSSTVSGLWPAVWTMGNLGRAGFGASLEGLWPYSYDTCDVGTLPNQTYPGTQTPLAAIQSGDPGVGGELSYLPGQRLSACTCPGESHPGPRKPDGSYVGRAAPEIDILEAIVDNHVGQVSLSAQWGPFNQGYQFLNPNTSAIFDNPAQTHINSYRGSCFQQSTSALSLTDPNCYETPGTCFALYGFEYQPGFNNAYISWINQVRAWTLYSSALDADTVAEIGQRNIPLEPMYIIANLGISEGFGQIDRANLQFPATMYVDYIRVYQRKSQLNVGCDPHDFPTAQYINTYQEAYTNANLTVWADLNQPWPKNIKETGAC